MGGRDEAKFLDRVKKHDGVDKQWEHLRPSGLVPALREWLMEYLHTSPRDSSLVCASHPLRSLLLNLGLVGVVSPVLGWFGSFEVFYVSWLCE